MKVVQREQGPFEAIMICADNIEEIKTFLGSRLDHYTMNREGNVESVTFYGDPSNFPHTARRGNWIVKDIPGKGFRSLSPNDFVKQFRITDDENAASGVCGFSNDNKWFPGG